MTGSKATKEDQQTVSFVNIFRVDRSSSIEM